MYMVAAEITCDECGETESMQENCKCLRMILKDSGWINRGNRDYCSKCKNTLFAKNKESIFQAT